MFSTFCYPKGSMYGIFTYIWLIFMVYLSKYTIHGSNGYNLPVVDAFKHAPISSHRRSSRRRYGPWRPCLRSDSDLGRIPKEVGGFLRKNHHENPTFPYEISTINVNLGGGNSKIFYFYPETWGMIQFDEYFSIGLKPPTSFPMKYQL